MRVLIVNIYNYLNKGDAAIGIGMLRELHDAFNVEQFFLSSSHHDQDQQFYTSAHEYPVEVVNSLFRIVHHPHIFWKLCKVALSLIIIFSRLWKVRPLHRIQYIHDINQLLTFYQTADVVISCGGGYLYTSHPWKGVLNLVTYGYSFLIARLFHKPIILYAQSIGPFFYPWHASLVASFLRKTNLILVRENISYEIVTKMSLLTPVVLTGDAAFLLPTHPVPEYIQQRLSMLRTQQPILVGITVRDWLPKAQQHLYEQHMMELIVALHADYRAHIIFIPQVMVPNGDNDLEVAHRIFRSMPASARDAFSVWDDDLSPQIMKGIIGELDFFIGTRMHSNIFALSRAVPTIAIGYLPKTRGIMRDLHMEHFVLNIDECTAARATTLFRQLMEQKESIRSELKERIPIVEQSVRKNSIAIKQYVFDNVK